MTSCLKYSAVLKAKGRLLQAVLLIMVAVFPLVLISAAIPANNPDAIVLRSGKLAFTPWEYYIAEIIDEREDKKAVAYLLPVGAGPVTPAKVQPVDLQGGALNALRAYIQQGIPPDPKLRPVVLRLREMQVMEKPGSSGRVAGQVSVVMAFELKRGDDLVPLLQYKGGGRYERPTSRNEVTEPALNQSLAEALRYLNTWMDREAGTNEKLATDIRVSFTDYSSSADSDTVFYTSRRPLQWQDFKAAPNPSSRFAATVFPSFAYAGDRRVENGVIHLNLTMKVYVLKGASWVKASARDTYGLNHEQRHFDIVKLVAERFKQKIRSADLSLEDYNSNIQYHFIESYREMNQLQDQYDAETRHGLDKPAQERWNLRLEKELKELEVK